VSEIEESFAIHLQMDRLFAGEPSLRQFAQWILSETQTAGEARAQEGTTPNVAPVSQQSVEAPGPPAKRNGTDGQNGHSPGQLARSPAQLRPVQTATAARRQAHP